MENVMKAIISKMVEIRWMMMMMMMMMVLLI